MLRMIRHAKSEANGTMAIARGDPNAPLSEEGLGQIPALREAIIEALGERPLESVLVNVTQLRRTRQTAQELGFRVFRTMPILDESAEAAPLRELIPKMKQGWLPHDKLVDAEKFLDQPEMHADFNFSHGLTIASIRYVAGERPPDGDMIKLVPFYAEMIEINNK